MVVGDFHVGSRYGLNLPEYVSPKMERESDCLMLYEDWEEVIDWANKVHYAFFMGDMCDGWNPKEHGNDRTQEENAQVESASKLAKMIRGNPECHVVEGSGYHRGSKNLDDLFAKEINAVPHPKYGYFAWPDKTLEIEKVPFHLAHNITVSKSTWQYRTTPAARELILAILNENPARIVLRAHAHYYVYAGFTKTLGMVIPGFQTQTPFMTRISPFNEPRWGGVLFEVDGENFVWDENIWKPDMKAEMFRGGR